MKKSFYQVYDFIIVSYCVRIMSDVILNIWF